MPRIIDHIDAIARRLQRDVLYLEFHPEDRSERRAYRYQQDEMRVRVLDWLDATHVAWQECGPFANPNVMGPYLGQLYLDVAYDEHLAEYRQLRDYLEFPDGSMRNANVRFYCLTLDAANKNSAHDEPGFWERLAEDF